MKFNKILATISILKVPETQRFNTFSVHMMSKINFTLFQHILNFQFIFRSIMKNRFTTLDISAAVAELREMLMGMRVNNCYDCSNKIYLLKFQKPDVKHTLLLESGIRFHTTTFDWPKGTVPNGFSMKLRKHIRGKRLVDLRQLGTDRVICMTFGEDEFAFHLIVELYSCFDRSLHLF